MSSSDKILHMFKEAELYRKQGLLDETVQQYRKIEKIILKTEKIRHKASLLEKLAIKIKHIDEQINSYNETAAMPVVSEKARHLMRSMFSIDDPEVMGSASLGEAIVLARFGQYAAATLAFESLFDNDHLRMHAAKKMLEYGLEYKTEMEMLWIIQKWEADHRFSIEDKNYLIKYLQDLLKTQPASDRLEKTAAIEPESEIKEDHVLDISAVYFEVADDVKTNKSRKVKLEVSFQHGTRINVLVPENETGISQHLKTGDIIQNVGLRSLRSISLATLYVQRIRKIDFGVQQGDTSITLKIINIITN